MSPRFALRSSATASTITTYAGDYAFLTVKKNSIAPFLQGRSMATTPAITMYC